MLPRGKKSEQGETSVTASLAGLPVPQDTPFVCPALKSRPRASEAWSDNQGPETQGDEKAAGHSIGSGRDGYRPGLRCASIYAGCRGVHVSGDLRRDHAETEPPHSFTPQTARATGRCGDPPYLIPPRSHHGPTPAAGAGEFLRRPWEICRRPSRCQENRMKREPLRFGAVKKIWNSREFRFGLNRMLKGVKVITYVYGAALPRSRSSPNS